MVCLIACKPSRVGGTDVALGDLVQIRVANNLVNRGLHQTLGDSENDLTGARIESLINRTTTVFHKDNDLMARNRWTTVELHELCRPEMRGVALRCTAEWRNAPHHRRLGYQFTIGVPNEFDKLEPAIGPAIGGSVPP